MVVDQPLGVLILGLLSLGESNEVDSSVGVSFARSQLHQLESSIERCRTLNFGLELGIVEVAPSRSGIPQVVRYLINRLSSSFSDVSDRIGSAADVELVSLQAACFAGCRDERLDWVP